MIKKISLFSTLLLCTPMLYASASTAEGFYFTAGAGGISSHFKTHQLVELGAQPRSHLFLPSSQSAYSNRAAGNLGLGYLMRLGQQPFTLGIEASAVFSNTQIHTDTQFQELKSSLSLSGETTTKLKNNFAILIKPGILMGDDALLYGLIGSRWGRFETATEASFLQNIPMTGTTRSHVGPNRNSGYKAGITAGLGVNYQFSDHWGLALEYAYTQYGKLSLSQAQSAPLAFTSIVSGKTSTGGSLSNHSQQISAKTNTIMLNITYKFL